MPRSSSKVNTLYTKQQNAPIDVDLYDDVTSLDEGGKVNPYLFHAETFNTKKVMTQKLHAKKLHGAAHLLSSSKTNNDQAHKQHRINLFQA